MAKTDHFLITCEHGGNRIPSRYRHLFADIEALLQTHRGYDAGALALAKRLGRGACRALVLLHHQPPAYRPQPLARPSAPILRVPLGARQTGFALRYWNRYYLPYRNKVEAEIAEAIARGRRVIHVASHSFTPVLDGAVRNADIGLLYDPARSGEAELCRRWQAQLRVLAPNLKVRRNYPYAGKSDGLTAYLRRRFPADVYIGIELEVNQKHVISGGRHWRDVRGRVIEAFCQLMTG